MSDALNHFYCGEYALEEISKQPKQIIKRNRSIYDLGTQGPDIFLYDGALPWKKSRGLVNLGSLLHKRSTDKFFLELVKAAKKLSDETKYEKALAYIFGMICHLSLDANTHPYINYNSGIYIKEKKETHKYKYCHKKLEVGLDIAFSDYIKKIPAVEFPRHNIFKISNEEIEIVHYIYDKVIRKIYGKSLTVDDLISCLKEAVLVQRITSDKSGIKTYILSKTEKRYDNPFAYTRAIYVYKLNDNIDYLNIREKTWYNPCDITEKHNESYPELFNTACKDATKKINLINNLVNGKLNNNITLNKINDIIKDVSFDTGRPYSDKDQVLYSDSILI